MNFRTSATHWVGFSAGIGAGQQTGFARILQGNKTRQGYARKRILKPAGYFFVRGDSLAQGRARSLSWQR